MRVISLAAAAAFAVALSCFVAASASGKWVLFSSPLLNGHAGLHSACVNVLAPPRPQERCFSLTRAAIAGFAGTDERTFNYLASARAMSTVAMLASSLGLASNLALGVRSKYPRTFLGVPLLSSITALVTGILTATLFNAHASRLWGQLYTAHSGGGMVASIVGAVFAGLPLIPIAVDVLLPSAWRGYGGKGGMPQHQQQQLQHAE